MADELGFGGARSNRVQLIARVQIAHDELCDTVRRRGAYSARVRAARFRLWVLNRALAMVALESAA